MKCIILSTILLACSAFCSAQDVTRTIDAFSGDSIISTGFDTLNLYKNNNSVLHIDRMVGIKTVHKKKPTYWLFFYFPASALEVDKIIISPKRYAYFVKTNNQVLRFPYSGRTFTYTKLQQAGFFVDITNSLETLEGTAFKSLRFETSTLYYEMPIPVKKEASISNLINKFR